MKSIFLILLTVLTITCCQPLNSSGPQVLIDTDLAFSKLSAQEGMNEAFAAYIAEDGVILRENSFPIIGRNNVVDRLNRRSDTTFRLTWQPMYADLAQSGDLGYTYGTYLVSSISGDSLGTGTYISIWKKQTDNSWKFVFDAGNEGLRPNIN